MTQLPADLVPNSNESIAELVSRCWTLGRTGRSSAGLAAAKHYSSLAMASGDMEAAAQASNQIAWAIGWEEVAQNPASADTGTRRRPDGNC